MSDDVNTPTVNAFQKNLTEKSEKEFRQMCESIGVAIQNVLRNHGQHLEMYCDGFTFRYIKASGDYGYGSSKARVIIENKEHLEKIDNFLKEKAMKDFQDALNNFAWAVQNQGN